tara:strand:+ start:142 stop:324 length:183 start_codon:yes stop_codon:yes gene_type:complete
MKQTILDTLENFSQAQINLESKSARETLANSIMIAIKSTDWFLDLNKHGELEEVIENETK